jgi:DNA-binding NtrC family response regulator
MQRVLIVEEDEALRTAIATHLRAHGFDVRHVGTHAGARSLLAAEAVDAVVLDHLNPDGEAFDLLPDVFARSPRPVVIVLTANGTIDLAVRAVKEGVQQFLTKPVELATLVRELRQYLGQREALARRAPPIPTVSGVSQRAVAAPFFGPSEASQRLREQLTRARDGDGPVLLLGETGTGKSQLARYLHTMSPRGSRAFVEVNCAATSREHVAAEIFGVDGATSKAGLLEAADGGTLFLDAIADLDVAVQAKLLDVIEKKRFRRVGGVDERAVDVRVLAATNRDLAAATREGTFRSDLHARLATSTVVVPALRECADDIVPLSRQFLDQLSANLRRPRASLSPEAEAALRAHTWPGNARELKNCLERALILGDGGLVLAGDVQLEGMSMPPSSTSQPRMSGVPQRSLESVEIEHIRTVLADVGGRVDAAAVELQMPRSTLYERIRRYGIDLSEFRARRKSP